MLNEDGSLTDSVLWFENIDDVSNMITSVVRSWTMDSIPEDVYTEQDKFTDFYTEETQANEIESVYVKGLFERRLKEFQETKIDVENNVIKAKEE
jgi:hypothetical protein